MTVTKVRPNHNLTLSQINLLQRAALDPTRNIATLGVQGRVLDMLHESGYIEKVIAISSSRRWPVLVELRELIKHTQERLTSVVALLDDGYEQRALNELAAANLAALREAYVELTAKRWALTAKGADFVRQSTQQLAAGVRCVEEDE